MARTGVEEEFDVDQTIKETAKKGYSILKLEKKEKIL